LAGIWWILLAERFGATRNPACNELCSKCFRDIAGEAALGKANEVAAAAALAKSSEEHFSTASPVAEGLPARAATPLFPPPPSPSAAPLEASVAVEGQADAVQEGCVGPSEASPPDALRKIQKDPGRCFACKKKVATTLHCPSLELSEVAMDGSEEIRVSED
jgi:hypothetical protein